MKAYLDIVNKVLAEGSWKENRTGIKTLASPGVFFEHDLSTGFPLLTVRKMPIKSIAVELEGFLKGITSKKWYQERGCHFWDQWANPKEVDRIFRKEQYEAACNEIQGHLNLDCDGRSKEAIAREWDDLGPLGYSFQLRRFCEAYHEDDNACLHGVDQLKNIVDALKSNPNDRRMVASLWSPHQLDSMALPPCTVSWVVAVIGGKLHLSWLQRSCDVVLGLPSDIASNAILLSLLALEAGLEPGRLTGLLVDCHIYENHIENAKILLDREPRKLPELALLNRNFDIFKWTHEDFFLEGYNPHPKLNMGEIAV